MNNDFKKTATQLSHHVNAASTCQAAFPEDLDTLIAEIKEFTDCAGYEQQFQNTIETAVQEPSALYRFFALYNQLNAGIASTVQVLVGRVNQSTKIFADKNINVTVLRSRSFEFGKIISVAATDEIGDSRFENLTHQLLAMGVVNAVGNYAELNTEQKNELGQIPDWLDHLIDEKVQPLYEGKKNDVRAMAQALGAHIYSEFSADSVEFSRACKTLFIDLKDGGFHSYLQKNPSIVVQGHKFDPTFWLKTHGGYDEETGAIHSAEYDHLKTGFEAAKLWLETAPVEYRQTIYEGLYEGMRAFHVYLREFFANAEQECRFVVAVRRAPVARAAHEPCTPA